MNNDSQTLKWDTLKGNPEDNICLQKQVFMDISNSSVEDRTGGVRNKHSLSWITTIIQKARLPPQDEVEYDNALGVYRLDRKQIEDLLHNADTLGTTFRYNTPVFRYDMVNAVKPPLHVPVKVSSALDGTGVTIYDTDFVRAVERMQALLQHLMEEAMRTWPLGIYCRTVRLRP